MKIEIQSYWNIPLTATIPTSLDIDEQLKKRKRVVLCAIIIDGKVVGEVVWDGKELGTSKELVREAQK